MKRLRVNQWVLAFAALLLAPAAAIAEGESLSRLEAMESRLMALEDKLAASEATIAAQEQLLENAQINAAGSAPRGSMAQFFDDLVVGGYVEASYGYSFDGPDQNIGVNPTYQFNQNSNSFGLDAVKLELGKPAAEPGTAGFQFDVMFGDNATALNSTANAALGISGNDTLGDDGLFIQQGYVSYNMRGVVMKMGKFTTPIGYEVIDAPYNPHVTHSELFFAGIPLFHTGLMLEGNIGESIQWLAGVTNGWNNSVDFNDNKAVLGSIGWTGDMASLRFNGYYGSDALRFTGLNQPATLPGGGVGGLGRNSQCTAIVPATPADNPLAGPTGCYGKDDAPTQIYEIVATLSPTDTVEFWFDGVYGSQKLDASTAGTQGLPVGGLTAVGNDPWWWAIAAGPIVHINELTDLALRYGYFYDHRGTRLGGLSQDVFQGTTFAPNSSQYQSVTATLSRSLTENLTARVEYRHDWVSSSSGGFSGAGLPGNTDRFYLRSGNRGNSVNDYGVIEFNYVFN